MPSYKAHIILATIPSAYIISELQLSPTHTVIALASVVAGSLFPDIDTPNSFLGRKLLPISFIINKIFHHRGLFHSLIFYTVIFLFIPFYIRNIVLNQSYCLVWAFLYIGIVIHILLDKSISMLKYMIRNIRNKLCR